MTHSNLDAMRPPARLIMGTPVHLLAFGFGSGLAPAAPGTFGTLAAVPFFLALAWLPPTVFGVALLILFAAGCWICGESARLLGVHDYGGIVFDEFVGLFVAAAPLVLMDGWTPTQFAWGLLLAVLAFRLFDIVKPWPIRWLDRHVGGGFGIMIDDLLAGAMAAVPLALLGWWWLGGAEGGVSA